MLETRGRKSTEVYVDGDMYVVKKPLKLRGSVALLLPKEWLDIASAVAGKEVADVRYFLLDVKDTLLTIRPYYESIPELDGEE